MGGLHTAGLRPAAATSRLSCKSFVAVGGLDGDTACHAM